MHRVNGARCKNKIYQVRIPEDSMGSLFVTTVQDRALPKDPALIVLDDTISATPPTRA